MYHWSIHLLGWTEMVPTHWVGDVSSAWLRRPGTGTLECPYWTIFATLWRPVSMRTYILQEPRCSDAWYIFFNSPFKFPTPEKSQRAHQDCNMQLVYCTTPSNYFHVLRRQIHRDFRKPLVVFFSKALLRHPLAKSSLKEMEPGTFFQPFLLEAGYEGMVPADQVKRHIVGGIFFGAIQCVLRKYTDMTTDHIPCVL